MWKRPIPGNAPKTEPREPLEAELARRLAAVLRDRLPRQWQVSALWHRTLGSALEMDAELNIVAPDGRTARVAIEVKSRLEPKDVVAAVRQAKRYGAALAAEDKEVRGDIGIIVGSEYLSPRARELLVSEGAGYADLTGNVRIAVNDPPIVIELRGLDTNPWTEDRPLRSLKGAAAGRVMRALCDFRPPYGVKELAERSNTPISTVSRVVNLLDTEALLTREPRGGIRDVQWPELIRRWAQDYSFSDSNRVASYLQPRGLAAVTSNLSDLSVRYAVTGSLAAVDLAPVAPPRLATIFIDSPAEEVVRLLDLRPAESGANVLLAYPYDPVVYDRTRKRDGLTCAAPSQVAADLLTGPGRAPAEAEALLDWMREHESDWRA